MNNEQRESLKNYCENCHAETNRLSCPVCFEPIFHCNRAIEHNNNNLLQSVTKNT